MDRLIIGLGHKCIPSFSTGQVMSALGTVALGGNYKVFTARPRPLGGN